MVFFLYIIFRDFEDYLFHLGFQWPLNKCYANLRSEVLGNLQRTNTFAFSFLLDKAKQLCDITLSCICVSVPARSLFQYKFVELLVPVLRPSRLTIVKLYHECLTSSGDATRILSDRDRLFKQRKKVLRIEK